nr:MAG TPA: hypothetical protein [Caudoviricetes sp.]
MIPAVFINHHKTERKKPKRFPATITKLKFPESSFSKKSH